MRQYFYFRPLDHAQSSEVPELHLPVQFSPAAINVDIDQQSVTKRWGYNTAYRDLNKKVYSILIFQKSDGSQYTLYLTETDLCNLESSGSNTYSYKTQTYTTGTITNITGAVVTGNATSWSTSGVAAGDYFILDVDHSSQVENDSNWAVVQTVDSDTQITLTANYTGTTGAMSNNYKLRKIYSLPTDDRWAWAVVNDRLCFSNGNINVQSWTGSGYASDLDSTNATNAKYLIEYANRLCQLDFYESGTRDPYSLKYSKEYDPTTWVDSTAGTYTFLETGDYIMGASKVGTNIVIYKTDSTIIGYRTGKSTDPMAFSNERKGIGCIAPYSIVEFLGTSAWVGRNDFYFIDGDMPRILGAGQESRLRYRIFDITNETEIKNIIGFHASTRNQIIWFANTTGGYKGFVWNYKNGEWSEYSMTKNISALGRGAI